MGFFGELVKEVIEGAKEGLEKGLKEGAKGIKETLKETFEYHASYKELVREVESENPNPEQILKSADIFLPLAVKLEERTEDDREFLRDNMRKYAEVLFFKGCALLKLNRSKEAFKSWGELIDECDYNHTNSEVHQYVIASYKMLDDYHGCPRCGSCHVKKVKHTGSSMAKNAAGQAGYYAGGVIGAAIGTVVLPGIGSTVGGWIGQQLGSIGGESLAEAAMSGVVRECPDCGYEFSYKT